MKTFQLGLNIPKYFCCYICGFCSSYLFPSVAGGSFFDDTMKGTVLLVEENVIRSCLMLFLSFLRSVLFAFTLCLELSSLQL